MENNKGIKSKLLKLAEFFAVCIERIIMFLLICIIGILGLYIFIMFWNYGTAI